MSPEDLLEELVCGMVDYPDEVKIDCHIGDSSATFDIHVADSDVGKMLGRGGTHAMALRTLFGAVYGKLGKRLHLQVIDPRR